MNTRPRRTLGALLAGLAITATLAACSAPIEETAQAAENTVSVSPTTEAESEAHAGETTSSASDPASSSAYADGEYTATGSYTTPGGRESVTVTVTLTNDVVTALTVEGSAERGDSQRYQSEFIENISSEVVGVAIDDLNVSKVAGSSLTSSGFNDAISQIVTEAQA